MPDQHRVVGSKALQSFTRHVVKVYNLYRV
jgi:hypothetical protein